MLVEVFCCYARKDQMHLQRLKSHLTPLQRRGFIALWTDSDIPVGAEQEEEINKHLETAHIILLLISPDFIASDYCYSKEMMRALERQKKGEVHVVPIILRPVHWQDIFGQLQALPRNGKPVTTWSNQDEALYYITNDIIELINEMNGGKNSFLVASEMHYGQTGKLKKKRVLELNENAFYREDWSSAPRAGNFYGRKKEIVELKQWIENEHCQLVTIMGIGGIGKTSLSVALIDQLKSIFDYIFWRSLQNVPSLQNILQSCIQLISNQQLMILPQSVEDQISMLIEYLQQHRCLIVLDNVESILQSGRYVGQYYEGYEGYGKLFQRIGEVKHQSCLLLTSREKPKEVALLEGMDVAPVRSRLLKGLKLVDGRKILRDKGLHGTEAHWKALVTAYDGNPLALKLAAQFIQEGFDGNITTFLESDEMIFSDIRDVLKQQFNRLSPLEQEIMYELAIEREAISVSKIDVWSKSKRLLLEALRSLRRRCMIEARDKAHFTLLPVVMEYVTDVLIVNICNEIYTDQPELLVRHALMKAQAKDYVRDSQIRLILMPIIQQLLDALGTKKTEEKLRNILSMLRNTASQRPSYVAGNLLNMLIEIRCDLHNYDFSYLQVRQAYLQGKHLPDVNFSHAYLGTSVFTDIFGNILTVAFSPDGSLLASGSTNCEVRIWRIADTTPLFTFKEHTHWVWSVAFSPDGKLLASGSEDATVRLWEISTGHCFKTLHGHTSRVRSVVFSPDGKLLASSSIDQTVRFWDIHEGLCLNVLHGYPHGIWSIAWNPVEGMLASDSQNSTISLWATHTGLHLNSLHGHTHWVRSVVFSPDGRLLASGSEDTTVRLWDVHTGLCIRTLQGHVSRVRSVTFSPDGRLLASGSEDTTIRLWDVHTGLCIHILHGHTNGIMCVVFNPDDNNILASCGEDQTIRLWDVHTRLCHHILQGYTSWVRTIAFSPDGKIFASDNEDATIRLWDAHTGYGLYTLHGHTNWIRSIDISPDGKLLASASNDHTTRLWDIHTGRCLHILQGHTDWVRAVAFSPDGKLLASGSEDTTIRLWDIQNGSYLYSLEGRTNGIWSVSFSPDGKLLASGSEDFVVGIWDIHHRHYLKALQGHTNWVRFVAFNPNSSILASASQDTTVRLWNVHSGLCLYTLEGHTDWVRSVTFSSDGDLLASASNDHTIRLWDVHTGHCLHILQGHTDWVRSAVFSPEGGTIISGSKDGTIKYWDVSTGTCFKTSRSDRPYERMNITGTTGLTDTQKSSIKILGAIDEDST